MSKLVLLIHRIIFNLDRLGIPIVPKIFKHTFYKTSLWVSSG